MKALVLAAGLGKRMRPLTLTTPKPLLKAGDFRLIDWTIGGLVKAGVTDIVVNAAHLSHIFEPILGSHYRGADITLSIEGPTTNEALETLGGIARALPLLTDGAEPFIVAAGDIATDFDFSRLLAKREALLAGAIDAHLVLVENPSYHAEGDMGLVGERVTRTEKTHTFASFGIYSPRIFVGIEPVWQKLFPWLYRFVDADRVTGEIFSGFWANVGTPEALAQLTQDCQLGKVPPPYMAP